MTDKILSWFKDRGISEKTLKAAGVEEGKAFMPQAQKEMNCILFHYYRNGEKVNTKFRDAKKNFKFVQGAEKIFYNIDALTNEEHDDIVVVEGEIDALSFIEAGVQCVISVPNGATTRGVNADYLDDYIDFFEQKKRIVLALDDDEAGQNLQQEFVRRLGAESCYLADFAGCKDANEYLTANGSERLATVFLDAPQCPLENVLTAEDIKENVYDLITNGFKPGYQIGLPGFDDVFSTYTKQFITVTGIPSSGKSDFVDMMCLGYNKNYGWKTAYASPENQPFEEHIRKLLRKKLGKMVTRDDIGTTTFNEAFDHINNNFFFIEKERYDLDEVLDKAAELVKRKGIKVLVIDPFNKITMKGKTKMSINDYTMEYLSKVDNFVRKYDCLVILVAHPTKMYKNDKTGKLEEPNFYNVKGGGEFYDASYHGLCVHRDYEAKTVGVRVMKVKFQNLGENNARKEFTWDPPSGNYIPLKQGTNEWGGAYVTPPNDDLPF